APILDVAGEAIFLGTRSDEAPLRTLFVGLHLLGDLRFQSDRLERALHRLAGRRQLRRLLRIYGFLVRRRYSGFGLESRHQLARLLLQLLDLLGGHAQIGRRAVARQYRQRTFGASVGVGIAAAVEMRLRKDLGLSRLRRRFGVDQRHFEWRAVAVERLQVERAEFDREHE